MKRIISIVIATVMMTTIFMVPTVSVSYAKSVDTKAVPSNYTVILGGDNYSYTGKQVKPYVTVKCNGKKLSYGSEYTLSYANNIYPGLATVYVHVDGLSSPIKKQFYIAKIKTFYASEIGTSHVKLKWARMYNVSGYEVYSYNFAKQKWQWKKTLKGSGNTTCTISKLGAGLGYQFKVIPYVKKRTGVDYGVFSKVLAVPTRPAKVTMKGLTSAPNLSVTASWNKAQGTGYQVALSTSATFSKYSKFNVKSYKQLSQRISKLLDNTTYYVKVRAYRTYAGKTVYGAWSKSKKVKTDGTRWYTSGGKKYYYKKGKKAYGAWTISGNKYYFSTNTGELLGVTATMWNKVKDKSSRTKYLIAVSRDLNRTCLYHRVNGQWVVKDYWKCTTGAKGTRTPAGSFLVPSTETKLNFFGLNKDYTCWYATRITGSIYFHSVLYFPFSKTNIQDGRLGYNLSHGCIRLSLANAKWIHKNINKGTRVVIY